MSNKELLLQLSPVIRKAFYHKEVEFQATRRMIFDYELLYLEKGELLIEMDGETHRLQANEMVLFRPERLHSFRICSTEEAWMPHIHFDLLYYPDYEAVAPEGVTVETYSPADKALFRTDVLELLHLDIPGIIRNDNNQEIFKLIQRVIELWESPKSDMLTLLQQKALMMQILHSIIQGVAQTKSRVHRQLQKAVQYIHENYNRRISLEHLSKLSLLSVFYFERVFKKTYAVSPIKFQMQIRMNKAKEMMLESNYYLSDIAEKVGYSSVHAFSKAFKKMEGLSPSEFISAHHTATVYKDSFL